MQRVATFRAWFSRRFPVVTYHLGLLRGIRGPSTDAAHWVADWFAVIVLFGAGLILFFSAPLASLFSEAAVSVDPRWAFVPWGLLVLYGLMKANYAEIEKRDARVKELIGSVIDYQHKYMFDPFNLKMIEELSESLTLFGYERLIRRLDRQDGSQAELTAEFDTWEAQVSTHIALIDKEEVEFFRRPLDAIAVGGDWRDRLRTLLEVRKSRMETIQVRQRLAYQRKVEEREKANKG